VLAEVELQRNRTRFIAEAEHTIATSPAFARWRLPNKNRRSQSQPASRRAA
jgi:galactose-1-phosphate uridylyltransferase